jgi:phosphopantothenoylcysteine decarboxylase/phosphopantothenate--cysteine ligase
MLLGKKIILGVCGSIAAYKAAYIVRLLVKKGAEVKVIMTASATSFITPLTLSTLSQHPVFNDLISADSGLWNNHVALGLWADYMVIAPASAHTIGKLANGICDNILTSVYLSAKCPVCIAPAMDLDMFSHPSVQNNLSTLASFGNLLIEPGIGELASGLYGKGRMAAPEDIIAFLENQLFLKTKLKGKNVLVTAGPTYEPLDPVRFIGNRSSGKMGHQLAACAAEMGAHVTLVTGPSHLIPPKVDKLVQVDTAAEMYDAVSRHFALADITILAAAVADYAPKTVHAEKIKKKEAELNLELVKTVDIAAEMGKRKQSGQWLVGFALETEHELENAERKLRAKNLDMVVLNSTRDAGATFGHDTNKITILKKDGSSISFDLKDKKEVASDIIHTLLDMNHEYITNENK